MSIEVRDRQLEALQPKVFRFLDQALQAVQGFNYLVARETESGGREFEVHRDYPTFKALYYSIPEELRTYHECLKTKEELLNGGQNSGMGRLCFDFDLEEKKWWDEFVHPSFCSDFEQCLRWVLENGYVNVDTKKLEFVWSQCIRPEKFSMHLTVKGALLDDFRNHLKDVYSMVSRAIEMSPAFYYLLPQEIIDPKLSSHINFRLVDSHKHGGLPLRLCRPDKYNLDDTLVRPIGHVETIDEQRISRHQINEFGRQLMAQARQEKTDYVPAPIPIYDPQAPVKEERTKLVGLNGQTLTPAPVQEEKVPPKLSEEHVLKLLNMVAVWRADQTKSWRNVGACLKAISNTPKIYEAWVTWSRRSPKYTQVKEAVYKSSWESFTPWKWSAHHLLRWAQTDSTDEFREFIDEHPEVKVEERPYIPRPYVPKRDCRLVYDFYSADTVKPYDRDKPTELIRSGMDTQKTRTLMKYIRENRILSGLFPTNRMNLAFEVNGKLVNVVEELNELLKRGDQLPHIKADGNVHLYLYTEVLDWNHLPPHSLVIVQLESLWKVKIPPPQLFIYDEATSLAKQFSSPTMNKNLEKVKEKFKFYLSHSDKVIAMDAHIDDRTINLLLEHRCRPTLFNPRPVVHVQWNLKQRGERRYDPQKRHCVGLDAVKFLIRGSQIQHAWYLVSQKKNLFIVCSTRKEADILEKFFQRRGVSVLSHTRDDSQEERAALRNVNELWVKYQVVIITSTITCGVDFNIPHFHSIFVFGNPNGPCVRDIMQMIGRVRVVIDGYLFYHIVEKKHRLPTKYATVKEQIVRRASSIIELTSELLKRDGGVQDLRKKLEFAQLTEAADRIVKSSLAKSAVGNEDQWFVDLHIRNQQEDNRSKNHFGEIFEFMLRENGIKIVMCSVGLPTNEITTEIIRVERLIKQEDREKKNSIPSITPQHAVVLQERIEESRATIEERDQLEKYHIEKYFQAPITAEEYDAFKNNKQQLLNVLFETSSTVEECYIMDSRRELTVTEIGFRADQLAVVKEFCQEVGLPSTISDGATFSTKQLKPDDKWFAFGNKVIKAFGMSGNPVRTTQRLMNVLTQMFRRWAKVELKAGEKFNERDGDGKQRQYTPYTLKVPKVIRTTLPKLRPISQWEWIKTNPVEKELEVSSSIVQEALAVVSKR